MHLNVYINGHALECVGRDVIDPDTEAAIKLINRYYDRSHALLDDAL